ncbi:MAG: DNA gyrase inhibitor YacG [Chromatiales bacterium]|jgi:endogenous inhibitor of DNA gyrase (YacG/DUF329 family)
MIVACPTCQKPVEWKADAPWRPFCSQRCRLIDLGQWFDEQHSIKGDAEAPIEFLPPDYPGTTE